MFASFHIVVVITKLFPGFRRRQRWADALRKCSKLTSPTRLRAARVVTPRALGGAHAGEIYARVKNWVKARLFALLGGFLAVKGICFCVQLQAFQVDMMGSWVTPPGHLTLLTRTGNGNRASWFSLYRSPVFEGKLQRGICQSEEESYVAKVRFLYVARVGGGRSNEEYC
ncbi:hypothetical protein B0H12DRAFT_1095256 [Mycena haematopus]|nr:hypothetical protein B0H12DRAFT_1095256 [Mycena haematopus]